MQKPISILTENLAILLVAIAEVFSFREDWHQDDRARPLVRQYQLTLDAVLRDRPDLQDCAVRCCHCGIRFFTHPRNAGRRDLRCPFGCRAAPSSPARQRAEQEALSNGPGQSEQETSQRASTQQGRPGRRNASPSDADAPPIACWSNPRQTHCRRTQREIPRTRQR